MGTPFFNLEKLSQNDSPRNKYSGIGIPKLESAAAEVMKGTRDGLCLPRFKRCH